jgi:DNA-directed RNA polymerase subunit H (RpoH/RPB5)
LNPRYPIYVISKGRWEKRQRLTVRYLDKMRVPYHIVIEPQEYKEYARVIPKDRILKLPFSNLGQGSIPARNWVWEHALASGAKRHWILDDNIRDFYRFNYNLKIRVRSGGTFRAAEDFVDRYENIALAGFQYFMFVPRKDKKPPFHLNTRIYSCILIRNDIPYRWRGRYNEDTDLSIRVLKDGWCTVLFNAFLIDKATTMTMKGGNTDELYRGVGSTRKEDDGRWKMAESLRKQHPDIVKITRKWNRWQHHVDYRLFAKNELRLKKGLVILNRVNNFGMVLEIDN